MAPFNELVRSTLSLQRRAEAVVEVAEEEADPDVVHMRGYKPPPDPTLDVIVCTICDVSSLVLF